MPLGVQVAVSPAVARELTPLGIVAESVACLGSWRGAERGTSRVTTGAAHSRTYSGARVGEMLSGRSLNPEQFLYPFLLFLTILYTFLHFFTLLHFFIFIDIYG